MFYAFIDKNKNKKWVCLLFSQFEIQQLILNKNTIYIAEEYLIK